MLPFHRVATMLRHASSVVVCAHVRPDGDAVGSVLGMTLALRAAGIPAVPTLADDREAPGTYAFLPGHSLYVPASELQAPKVFVALDTPVPHRLGVAEQLMRGADNVVMFDHHPDAETFGCECVCDPAMAATAQIVWRFLPSLSVDITSDIALPLYVGLITDTGRFAYDNTSPAALRDAAEMLDAGVSAAETARMVYQERSAASLELEARALSRLRRDNGGRVGWTYVTDDDFEATGAVPEEAEHLPDAIRVLGDIDVAMLLRQRGTEVRGNLRSKSGADVSTVARAFDGGGHRAAAGFTIADATVEVAALRVLAKLPGGDDE